jgi:hypothetical protein
MADAFCMNFMFCKNKRKKLLVVDMAFDIIENHMQIENIIKKLMEVEILKKLLLGNKKALLFDQQFKKLNIGNVDKTVDYLETFIIDPKRRFKLKQFEKVDDKEEKVDLNKLLLNGYRDNWNI